MSTNRWFNPLIKDEENKLFLSTSSKIFRIWITPLCSAVFFHLMMVKDFKPPYSPLFNPLGELWQFFPSCMFMWDVDENLWPNRKEKLSGVCCGSVGKKLGPYEHKHKKCKYLWQKDGEALNRLSVWLLHLDSISRPAIHCRVQVAINSC